MPRLLDLFCGAGGASAGYVKAGFEVVGVDNKPQPRYPWTFIQADAMTFPLSGFDVIHASPPCQRFSRSVTRENRVKHPDYIDGIRQRLKETDVPWIIENVPRSPLINPVQLCGSSFGIRIIRHRLFESNIPIKGRPCDHGWMPQDLPPSYNRVNPLRAYCVSGGFQKVPYADVCAAMGIDWMNAHELSESIPPVYTEYLGRQLMEWLKDLKVAA